MEQEPEKKETEVVTEIEVKKEETVVPAKEGKKWECKLTKLFKNCKLAQGCKLTECCKNFKGKWKMIVAGLVLLLVVAGGFLFAREYKKNNVGNEVVKAKIEKILKEEGGTVTKVEEEKNLYKVTISIKGQEQPVYVTKDGEKLVQGVITFTEIGKQQALAKKEEEASNREVPKAEKPKIDLYVMSFCPYGNKAEDTMKPVYELLKNKADFNFHYIVTVTDEKVQSLHGNPEVVQNQREACVLRDNGKDKWFAFVSYVNAKCGSDGACWEAGAKSLGLSTVKIGDCVAKDGLSLMKSNGEASEMANASGSPTMTINGVSSKAIYQYGKPEELKKTICDAFEKAPAECAKALAEQAAASTAQGGSCN